MRRIYKQQRDTHGVRDWHIVEFGCQYCKLTYKNERLCANHEEQCKIINTLKQEGEP